MYYLLVASVAQWVKLCPADLAVTNPISGVGNFYSRKGGPTANTERNN